jgi:hypothetical protein
MLVEPGFFRTELLTQESTRYAEPFLQPRPPAAGWTSASPQTLRAAA